MISLIGKDKLKEVRKVRNLKRSPFYKLQGGRDEKKMDTGGIVNGCAFSQRNSTG